jgi:hypothetical protein
MAVQVIVIAEWLGVEHRTDFDLAQIVRRGLPLDTQAVLMSDDLTKDEFHYIVIPLRTFPHRREALNKGQEEMAFPPMNQTRRFAQQEYSHLLNEICQSRQSARMDAKTKEEV